MAGQAMPGRAPAGRRRRMGGRQIVALVVLALSLVFILQNRVTVQIELFTVTVSSPLWLLLIIMVVLGMLIGFLVSRRR